MQLMPDQALPAYRDFLRQVLSEVIGQINGEPSLTRLTRAMQVYWDACLARRSQRAAAADAAAGTPYETQFEPLGQPFLKLLRSELVQIGCSNPEQLSRDVYLCARNITLEEARSGRRETQHRQSLLHCLQQAALD
ncbi:MAG TPA: hypothetical protein VLI06_02535 [Solimonas sp.]|nr:hypothetical protein [Solimonas sp.]